MIVGNILIVFKAIAGTAKRLNIRDVVGSASEPRDDVVYLKIIDSAASDATRGKQFTLALLAESALTTPFVRHSKVLLDRFVNSAVRRSDPRKSFRSVWNGVTGFILVGLGDRKPSRFGNLMTLQGLRYLLVSAFLGTSFSILAALNLGWRAVENLVANLTGKSAYSRGSRHFDSLIPDFEISMVRRVNLEGQAR